MYDEVYSNLKNLTGAKCICVTGLGKKQVLKKEHNSSIIDLETLSCPSLSILKQQSSFAIDCPIMHNTQNCPVNNVCVLSRWV